MLLTLLSILVLSLAAVAQEATPAAPAKPAPTAADKFTAELIPRNSKVYIGRFVTEGETDTGFATYLAAAVRKKNVPVILVANAEEADFEISGSADKKGTGWAKKLFAGDFRSTTSASIQVVNTKTGVVTYADASNRASANKGMRSSAEKLAKYFKKKIEDDEKKAAKGGR